MTEKTQADKKLSVFWFLKTLLPYYKNYPKIIYLVIFPTAIFTALFEGFIPISYKYIFDNVITHHEINLLFFIVPTLIIGFIIYAICNITYDFHTIKIGAKIVRTIQTNLFEILQKLSHDFWSHHQYGDIQSIFANDSNIVEIVITNVIPALFINSLRLIIYIILMLIISPWLSLLTFVLWSLNFIFPNKLINLTTQATKDRKADEGLLLNIVQENINLSKQIKYLNLEDERLKTYSEHLHDFFKHTVLSRLYGALIYRATQLNSNFTSIIVLCVGAYLTYHQLLTGGDLIGFLMLLLNSNSQITTSSSLIRNITLSLSNMQGIQNFLQTPTLKTEGSIIKNDFNHELSIKNVSLSFAELNLLNDINLNVPKGQFVAIVGYSGSGKSTLINLIMRLYKPEQGKILLDNVDINSLTFESYYSLINVIPQNPVLFNTTVLENIRMGRPNASIEEVHEAAKTANIHHSIMNLPRQYNTIVGERGKNLSDGQCQRIAIARALIKNSPILICDEITANLDPVSEHSINQLLLQLSGKLTIILITHHLAITQFINNIFVLSNGSIIEQGDHKQLMDLKGSYFKSWEKQNNIHFSKKLDQFIIDNKLFKSIPIFKLLSEEELNKITALLVTETFKRDEIIIAEGEVGDKFYIIAKGIVDINKQIGSESKKISEKTVGDFFGEIALLENIPRTATVTAQTLVIVLSLHRQQFQELLENNPQVRKHLEKLTNEMLEYNRKLKELN